MKSLVRSGSIDPVHARGKLKFNPSIIRAPATVAPEALRPGLHKLDIVRNGRDGLVYVPPNADTHGAAAPVVLFLHGAGDNANRFLRTLQPQADHMGVIFLIPESRYSTWDFIARGGFGPDLAFIDSALEWLFARCTVNTDKLAIGGFSDGASYALSVGLMNGNLFSHVLAFSPGFMQLVEVTDEKPVIFMSHGQQDEVLPVSCSHRVLSKLQSYGYEVKYEEFTGGHELEEVFVRAGLEVLLANTDHN